MIVCGIFQSSGPLSCDYFTKQKRIPTVFEQVTGPGHFSGTSARFLSLSLSLSKLWPDWKPRALSTRGTSGWKGVATSEGPRGPSWRAWRSAPRKRWRGSSSTTGPLGAAAASEAAACASRDVRPGLGLVSLVCLT